MMTGMDHDPMSLDRLDEIAWSTLDHAYGPADDVPELLRALVSTNPAKRAIARDSLHASLDHQGVQRTEATLRAIPFLTGLVADPATPDRAALVRLLAELAVGDTCWFLHDGIHPTFQNECDGAARAQACAVVRGRSFATRGFPSLIDNRLELGEDSGLRKIYDAVADGVPSYLAALDGADPALRIALPFLLGFLTPRAAASAPALERLCEDPSEPVRASAALGLSHACRFDPTLRARAFDLLMARWPLALGDLERRCLALALVRYEEPARTAAVREYLEAVLELGVPPVRPDEFPWLRIDSPPFVFCTTYLGSAGADQAALRPAALAAVVATSHSHDAADLGMWIARLWVPTHDGEELVVEDLDDDVRATLAALVASTEAWHYTDLGKALEGRGVPTERSELAAWLGVRLEDA